tara:strand:- start:103 stop:363 length:261 start_codon:yes stop_codon:yes gene_type:complete
MNYKQLQELLPNDEIHYIQDSINNPDDNLDLQEFSDESKYKYILYAYVMECVPESLAILSRNNISFTMKHDEFNLAYIIIHQPITE